MQGGIVRRQENEFKRNSGAVHFLPGRLCDRVLHLSAVSQSLNPGVAHLFSITCDSPDTGNLLGCEIPLRQHLDSSFQFSLLSIFSNAIMKQNCYI